MTDFINLAQLAAAVALLTLPPIALARWLSRGDGLGLAGLFAIPIDPPWPRGVREEEPVQWRIELLGPATIARRVSGPSARRAGGLDKWGGPMQGAIQAGACREP